MDSEPVFKDKFNATKLAEVAAKALALRAVIN